MHTGAGTRVKKIHGIGVTEEWDVCQRAGEREEARAAECEEERGEELGSTGQSYTRTRRKQKSSKKPPFLDKKGKR